MKPDHNLCGSLVKNQTHAVAFETRFVRTHAGQPQNEMTHCLKASTGSGDGAPCVAYGIIDDETVMDNCLPTMNTPSATGGGHPPAVATNLAVRRLTPRECERLQGFPDDWTLIPYRGKPAETCPDGPRYKALGNSMAVPVMAWIGKRIANVEGIK